VREFRTRGQPAALATIERAVATERPPHALLLDGPEHVGKTTLALDLVAGLLCLALDPAQRPCRACAACHKVEHGNHPDVHVLTAEGAGGQIRVGQVQALAAELALMPLEGRFRVALVEGAQRLNIDAQHALLKTLEEPPKKVVIVLATDGSAGLLPTVVSRCVRVRLGPVAADLIAGLIADAGLADAVRGAALARLAGGRPGLALRLARQPDAAVVQARLARTLLDLLAADRRRRLAAQQDLLDDGATLAAAVAGREPPSAAARRAPAERRAAAAQVLFVWREVTRDLAVAAHGGRAELRQHELIDELLAVGPTVPADRLTQFLARLDAAARALEAYANPELLLDSLLLIWPRPHATGT
jgi:DNA polymerase-3 subunit delta'